jgi:outer membrane protein assembly factor BamE (lipoprotein component of BamABCDE complex)
MGVRVGKSIIAAGFACAMALASCAPTNRTHGYAPDQGEIELLTRGVDTKLSIEDAVGAPSDSGLREDGVWYYVESTVRNFAFYAPEVTERRVLVLDFDGDGVLSDISQFGLSEGRVVNLQTRVTPTESRRRSVLQRLLGNVGAITPPLPAQ